MAKLPDDKQGKWVTIHGTHIFIKDGQSVEEAFAELGLKNDDTLDNIIDAVSYVQTRPWIHYYYDDDYKHRISPKKHQQSLLRKGLEKRASTEDDELITRILKDKVDEFILKDTDGSDLTWTSTWDKGRIVRLHLSTSGTAMQLCQHFFHECGHAIDMYRWGKHLSSEYNSKKYGVAMADTMFEEVQSNLDLEYIKDEYQVLRDEHKKLWEDVDAGKLDKREASNIGQNIVNAWDSLADLSQAVYGAKATKDAINTLGHKEDYYNDDNRRQYGATELFAELTESKNSDKNKRFYNLIKQYCPKTVEIYEEIMEGRKNGTIN